MKKLLVSILSICFFLCAMISVSADDHKHELHKMGERIKQAVKAGKITEKEGWEKWHAVLREHGHDDEEEHDDHEWDEDEEEWGEVEELEHEIEIRELEFELERLVNEHQMELMELNHERERMQREFDRERRDWDMENLQWDMRRKQMEMQMRGGHRPSGTHPQGHGSLSKMRRGGPHKGMMSPMAKGPGHGPARDGKTCPDSKGKSDCGKKNEKSACKKGKEECGKKDACKSGGCNKSGSCSKKDSASCKKDTKSCPSEKGKKSRGLSKDQSGKKKKRK